MTKGFWTVILSFCTMFCFGQKNYTDSLKVYRQQYIRDLYEIIKADTAYIRFYPPDPEMIVTATVTLLPDEQSFKMTTSSGKTKEARKYALLQFRLNGKPFQLYTYQLLKLKERAETAQELFLPFMDQTCGKASYGGGRYLDMSLTEIKEGKIILDFNKAYNPYCAFTTGYNCPVPPRENVLSIPVQAGEKYQKQKFRH